MKKLSVLLVVLYSSFMSYAQSDPQTASGGRSFTLEEAKSFAVENSYFTKEALMKEEIAQKRVKETRAIGLPQINAEGSFQNFLDIPTSILPGEVVGKPGKQVPVQFGTEYTASGGITASQLIFDGSYIVGLQAAKTYKEVAEKGRVKSQMEIKKSVTIAYANAIVSKENLKTIIGNKKYLEVTLKETRALFKEGFVEEQDLDQLEILLSTAENQLNSAKRFMEITDKLLKFQMGIDVSSPIELTSTLEDLMQYGRQTEVNDQAFDFNKHIDYQINLGNERLQMLNLRNKKVAYLPQLSGFFSYKQSYQANNLQLESKNWFPTTLWGLNLKVPIFSSGNRHFAVQQAKLDFEVAQLKTKQTEQELTLKFLTAKSDYKFSLDQHTTSKQNFERVERILNREVTKYKEGVSTSLNLANTQIQFYDIQRSYIQSMLNLIEAKSELDKALNNF